MVEAKDIIETAIKQAREKGGGKIISRDDIYNAIFKAGYEERDKWLSPNETDRLEEAMMAGKRLVVEWIDDHPLIYSPSGEDFSRIVEEWQAQKKAWFNEKV